VFDPSSRYYLIATATLTTPDGRTVAFVRRRLVPQPGDHRLLVEVVVAQGERLDLITARVLGDPEQFWRVCDANGADRPDELTASAGRRLRIPVPER
jgi:hypothetical protein